MKRLEVIREHIHSKSPRSAWDKGVKAYALELLDELEETMSYAPEALDNLNLLNKALLNGASCWAEYSEGGCSLISDVDIAVRLCTPSELRKTHFGDRNPNSRESWIDVQARALAQAASLIRVAYRLATKKWGC
jgi:hypothetical protein